LKPVLLIVEDNLDVLYNLKLTLEFNGYEVVTAENGLHAIEILSKLAPQALPNLIISDIMMPEMNGYDFFKKVSENLLWNSIPFIFLTAKTSPQDIRFGKMLGVDDYLVKPFKEEDLLASIAGKIARSQKIESINKKVEELFSNLKIDTTPSISESEKSSVILLYCLWDDRLGPTLKRHYPKDANFSLPLESVAYQLFNGVASIYGQTKMREAQGVLLNIENIKSQGYTYFDAIDDERARGLQRPFMVGVIAPRINYFESLRIKEILSEITLLIKKDKEWDPERYWNKISKILSTPLVP
jgi:CheY-like chemotaxis protein